MKKLTLKKFKLKGLRGARPMTGAKPLSGTRGAKGLKARKVGQYP